jgi:hypothetical protein
MSMHNSLVQLPAITVLAQGVKIQKELLFE